MSYPKSIIEGKFDQATDDELKRVIITIDGLGKKVQEKALGELLKREYERGMKNEIIQKVCVGLGGFG